MIIDKNKKEQQAVEYFKKGDRETGVKYQDEFIADLHESIAKKEDHCSCKKPCKHHGKCIECVSIHRAHRDHLPNCFHDMVNEHFKSASELTEHSIMDQIK